MTVFNRSGYTEDDLKRLKTLYYRHVKRGFDLLVGVGLLLLSSPLLIISAILIKLTSPGPIFYMQPRAGYQGRPFQIYKFRSMVVQQQDPSVQAFLDDPRITPVGRFIRRFKIDELPQLINIVNGDMSLVGPRPTLVEQMNEYTPAQFIRYEVRPGLTGWAQVNGNILLSVHERREHDVYYVKNLSFWLDFKILLMTGSVVLFGEKLKNKPIA